MSKIFLQGHAGNFIFILSNLVQTGMLHSGSRLFRVLSYGGGWIILLVSYFAEIGGCDLAFLINKILALTNLGKRKLWAFGLITVQLVAFKHFNRWYRDHISQIFLCLISKERNLILFRTWLDYIKRRLWLYQNRVILVIRMFVVIFFQVWHCVTLEWLNVRWQELILGITHNFWNFLIIHKGLRSVFSKARIPLIFLVKVISGNFIFFLRLFPFRMV